jgi:hypothetical protein
MAIKFRPTTRVPAQIIPVLTGKFEMTGFRFRFGFFRILKDEVGADNEDIDTHLKLVPKLIPLILKLDFTSFKLEILNQSLKLHSYF